MERTANIDLTAWRSTPAALAASRHLGPQAFMGVLIACAGLSALLASLVTAPGFHSHGVSLRRSA